MALKGECSRCGLCCYVGEFKCTNLVIVGQPGPPMASTCAVHFMRYPHMPIILRAPDGREVISECTYGNPTLEEEVLRGFIEAGQCSLEAV